MDKSEILKFRDVYVVKHKHQSYMAGFQQAMRDEQLSFYPDADKKEMKRGYERGVFLRKKR